MQTSLYTPMGFVELLLVLIVASGGATTFFVFSFGGIRAGNMA